MISNAQKFTVHWEYYPSLTQLARHLDWIIRLLQNWLNWKIGHANIEDFNYLNSGTFKRVSTM